LGDGEEGPLAKHSKQALDKAGILASWQGAAVMALAKLIDSGRHGASGAAGTIRAHREAMGVALDAADTDEADIISMIFREN
jgi:hypothetical protein